MKRNFHHQFQNLKGWAQLELWIWVKVLAALSNSIRSAHLNRLKNILGDVGASYVRFLYAIPFAWFFFFDRNIEKPVVVNPDIDSKYESIKFMSLLLKRQGIEIKIGINIKVTNIKIN